MSAPRHVGVIMDGNGRWAAARGLPRIKGHKAGVARVEEVIEAARDAGVGHLTLYAFSTENWRRPLPEVLALMAMFRAYLRIFRSKLIRHGIRFHHLGDPSGLPQGLVQDLKDLEAATAHGNAMVFHLAVNYGSRLELVHAVQRCLTDGLKPEDVDETTVQQRLWTGDAPDVDLLIRTSGEFRISNFLLWQAAYAELLVVDTYWPDFGRAELLEAMAEYARRDRRYGGL